jgi:hypothetical protein
MASGLRKLWESYWMLVLRRAAHETWRHALIYLLAGVAWTFLLTIRECRGDSECNLGEWVSSALWALVVYVGVIFIIQMLLAPPKIHAEQRQSLATLEWPESPVVRLVSKTLDEAIAPEIPIRFHTSDGKTGYIYEAHQVADGIELTWREPPGDRIRDYVPILPTNPRCVLETADNGRGLSVAAGKTRGSARAVYPKDFGVEPTTGRLRIHWYGTQEVEPLPSLDVLRGGRPSGWRPEPGKREFRFATWSIEIEVTKHGKLV